MEEKLWQLNYGGQIVAAKFCTGKLWQVNYGGQIMAATFCTTNL